ncbi:MAG: peptide chain release factor N(5)-glutamine methyltransferase [Leptospirales bacterium]
MTLSGPTTGPRKSRISAEEPVSGQSSIGDWLLWGKKKLSALDEPERESRALMSALLGSETSPWTRSKEALDLGAARHYRDWINRRSNREPHHQITGQVTFFGRTFSVFPGVLIPRPETEHIVELALRHLASRPSGSPPRILDLGAGSGVIGISVLLEHPDAWGLAVEREPEALKVLIENRRRHGLSKRLTIVRGHWGEMLAERPSFDCILSNPPYVPEGEIASLAPEVRDHEPWSALDGGPDGLDPYRTILPRALRLVRPGGLIALEIGDKMGNPSVFSEMAALPEGQENLPTIIEDVSGRNRVVFWTR